MWDHDLCGLLGVDAAAAAAKSKVVQCRACSQQRHQISARPWLDRADETPLISEARKRTGASQMEGDMQQQHKQRVATRGDEASQGDKPTKDAFTRFASIKWMGVGLFILASLFCLYKIHQLSNSEATSRPHYTISLKLVNVFNRHGDRAPSDSLPYGDKHGEKVEYFWPNGLTNLTDIGRLRQFRIGLELRHRYKSFIDYNSSHVLAFSSPMYRCQESVEQTLRGLFNIEWSINTGRRLVSRLAAGDCLKLKNGTSTNSTVSNNNERRECRLPNGPASTGEWRKVPIDMHSIPSLTYSYLNNCKYRLANPSPVDANLTASKAVAQLKGIDRLAKIIEERYRTKFNFFALGLWSTISNELRLARTDETAEYMSTFYDWINTRVPEYNNSLITLFDLYEQVLVFAYRDRIEGTSRYIQLAPIVSSLVESQLVALDNQHRDRFHAGPGGVGANISNGSQRWQRAKWMYSDKKVIIYSSHDTVLQLLMFELGLMHVDESRSYEERFNKWQPYNKRTIKSPANHLDLVEESSEEGKHDIDELLAGLRMCKFGLSLVLELWEAEERPPAETGAPVKRHAFVKAALYNREDGKYRPVEYKRLNLGSACRRIFKQKWPGGDLGPYYEMGDFSVNKEHSCPFDLWRNITSEYALDDTKLSQLCDR